MGRWIEFQARVTMASGFSVSNGVRLALPVTALVTPSPCAIECVCFDNGSGFFRGGAEATTISTTSTGDLVCYTANATYAAAANISGTAPMTWVAGDWLEVIGHYLAEPL
jgi:hypothetical protein